MSVSDDLYCVHAEDVADAWPDLAPLFAEYCEDTQTTTPDVILHKASTGEAQLWVYAPGGVVRGVGATQVYQHARGRYLNVWIATGALDPVIDHAISTFERWGREIGCSAIEIVGRKGWGRRLTGYRPRAVVFEKDLRGLH